MEQFDEILDAEAALIASENQEIKSSSDEEDRLVLVEDGVEVCSDDSSSSSSEGSIDVNFALMDEEIDDNFDNAPRSKNEITNLDPIPPFAEPFLNPSIQMAPLGRIHAVLDDLVIVETAFVHSVLDFDSLTVMENRHCLGFVFDTFGPIEQPFYSVRFPKEQIDVNYLPNQLVYYVPDQSKMISVEELKRIKGSDASNCYDEEPVDEEMEFSDDEKEMLHKQDRKKKKIRSKVHVAQPEIELTDYDYLPRPRPSAHSSIYNAPIVREKSVI